MSDSNQTRAQQLIGDFAPKLVDLTDKMLFGDIWERSELSPRDRSLVTVASLITSGSTEQLRGHLARAKANGLTETEQRSHHPSGLLRRLAQGDVCHHSSQGNLRFLKSRNPASRQSGPHRA